MNKTAYIKELDRRLKYLPKEDKEDVLLYYKEYIEEMNISDDEDVTIKLGKPQDVAREIIENCTAKAVEEQKENKSVKSSGKVVWLVILGIASLPVSLPITIAAVAVAVALLIAVFAIIIALFAASLAVLCAGLFTMGTVFVIPGFANKLATLGVGALVGGVGIFAVMGMIVLSRFIVRLIGRIFVRKKGE